MKSENLFNIWLRVGKQTPFIARRNCTYHISYKVVKFVPTGNHYGKAYGFKLYDGEPIEDKEEPISCSGCGNWELVEILANHINPKWDYIDENGCLTFGMHKGKLFSDVLKDDEGYIDWACSAFGGFRYMLIAKKYNVSIDDFFSLKEQVKQSLPFTADDWIKSRTQFNYDTFIEHFSQKVLSGERTIQSVSEQITRYFNNHKKEI